MAREGKGWMDTHAAAGSEPFLNRSPCRFCGELGAIRPPLALARLSLPLFIFPFHAVENSFLIQLIQENLYCGRQQFFGVHTHTHTLHIKDPCIKVVIWPPGGTYAFSLYIISWFSSLLACTLRWIERPGVAIGQRHRGQAKRRRHRVGTATGGPRATKGATADRAPARRLLGCRREPTDGLVSAARPRT